MGDYFVITTFPKQTAKMEKNPPITRAFYQSPDFAKFYLYICKHANKNASNSVKIFYKRLTVQIHCFGGNLKYVAVMLKLRWN